MSNQEKVRNSALWAAAADAAGWISELVDEKGLRRRIGGTSLSRTVGWKRKIGGLNGVEIKLPAGTYSDDTQLRLAVCRSIRSDGTFDAEAFAKVELPVWTTYALGAGRGTKAAAANLSKRDVTWFSNFFSSSKGPSYVDAGGNGAAMRIQPHVWANVQRGGNKYLVNVLRDSLITHGHMIGVCGAVFHARCLDHLIVTGSHSGPNEWYTFVEDFADIEKLVREDAQLSQFWLGAWEEAAGRSLGGALSEVVEIASRYVAAIEKLGPDPQESYDRLLDLMECRGRYVGAGVNTAIAAAYLAWAVSDVEEAVKIAINALGSDTDTIATMVGALAGYLAPAAPGWPLQDAEYISEQACRMAAVATGSTGDSFSYPDIATWRPPQTQSAGLGSFGESKAVRGLGIGKDRGEPVVSSGHAWQWIELAFGQTVLCKFKMGNLPRIPKDQLPIARTHAQEPSIVRPRAQNHDPVLAPSRSPDLFDSRAGGSKPIEAFSGDIDALTDRVIRSNFDSIVIGESFKSLANGQNAIEHLVAFSAIIGKAIIARKRKV